MTGKPTIPEVLDRFVAYHRDHPCWSGGLHSVLEEGNVRDIHVQHAVDWTEGEAHDLALILQRMSRTQRLKLPDMVEEANRQYERRPRAVDPVALRRLVVIVDAAAVPPDDVALAVPVYGWTP